MVDQMKSSVHPGDDNVKNKEVVAGNLSTVSEKDFSAEAIVVDDNNELNDIDEEEVNVCDTCGVLGCKDELVICHNCGVGAEHTYCMAVELKDVPEKWSCYDCVEDMSKSSIDLFEIGESAFQKTSENAGLDLNVDPSLNLNPNLDMNLDSSIDLNVSPNLELGVYNNLDLSLDCGSSYRSSSTINFQARTRTRVSPNPLLRQRSLEDEAEEEQQCAKRQRVDTRLSL